MARLVIISNRVAIPRAGSRAGGLEVAVLAALKKHPGIWFGWSGRVSTKGLETRTIDADKISYVVTDLPKEDYNEYYNGFANRVLWPILHYRLDLAEFSRRDLGGYLRVNEHFANELHKILKPDDVVWVHDYHLLPLAKALRERGHTNKIGFFLHTPFAAPEIITALPQHERDDIMGRRLSDNEELDDAPESAHVKRTAQESFEPEAFIVRRSMPWTQGQDAGLMFLAFGRTLDAFEVQLRRMSGLEDGITDALYRFSRPLTGGYYWCPPRKDGLLDLSALLG